MKKTPAQLDREIAVALSDSPSRIQLKDRYSGNRVELALREGRVVGAFGADPKRYLGLTLEEAKHHARYGGTPKLPTIQVNIGNGLKDRVGSAGAEFRLKQLHAKGATDIKLARTTGRLTFTRGGQRYAYRVTAPRNNREADAFDAAGTTESPLSRALADIYGAARR